MPKPHETAVYTHGHHESVLRSHTWRTAENSAAYLLGSLRPHMRILDIGCGPGTITADLAERVPEGHVTGVDRSPEIVERARAWRDWGKHPESWFSVLHGEILCRKEA